MISTINNIVDCLEQEEDNTQDYDVDDDIDDDDNDDSSEDTIGNNNNRLLTIMHHLLDTLIAPPLIDSMLVHRDIRESEVEHERDGQEVEIQTDERESATVCMNIGQEVEIEQRRADEKEETECNTFFSEGCGCHNKCWMMFSESYLRDVRSQMAELSREELDLVVMGEIAATIHDGDTIDAQKHTSKNRERSSTYYLHKGQRVWY